MIDLEHDSGGLADSYRGRWHIVYPDGKISVGMKKSTAKNYQRIFGGWLVKRISKKPLDKSE